MSEKEELIKIGLSNREADAYLALLQLQEATVKEVADKKKRVEDRDLESIVRNEKRTLETVSHYELENLQIACGTGLPTASACLRRTSDNVYLKDSALGTGPVDAIYKAINKIVQVQNELIEFSVNSVTEGIDALGEVTIRIRSEDGAIYSGHSANTDITIASAHAYINALNKMITAINSGQTILAQKQEFKSNKGV